MTAKLNINVLLKHLDKKNLTVYASHKANEEERKELERLAQYILPAWMGSLGDPGEQYDNLLKKFNHLINMRWWELRDNPELQLKLLGSAGVGKPTQHQFLMRYKRPAVNKLEELLQTHYIDIKRDEISLWCRLNTEQTLIDLCEQHGKQKDEITDIIKEYRKLL